MLKVGDCIEFLEVNFDNNNNHTMRSLKSEKKKKKKELIFTIVMVNVIEVEKLRIFFLTTETLILRLLFRYCGGKQLSSK